jgi:hypothetical protein
MFAACSASSGQPISSFQSLFAALAKSHQAEPTGASGKARATMKTAAQASAAPAAPLSSVDIQGLRSSSQRSPVTAPAASNIG